MKSLKTLLATGMIALTLIGCGQSSTSERNPNEIAYLQEMERYGYENLVVYEPQCLTEEMIMSRTKDETIVVHITYRVTV